MATPNPTSEKRRKARTKPARDAIQDSPNGAPPDPATSPITLEESRTKKHIPKTLPARANKIDKDEESPSQPSKKRTRPAIRNDKDENEHESDNDKAHQPKRPRKKHQSISDPRGPGFVFKPKLRSRKDESQPDVVVKQVHRADEGVKSKKGKDKFALSLFYGETASKQRHAKRILCIGSAVGPNHVMVPKESGTFQEGWGEQKTSVNIFLEGDFANTRNLTSKCHISFRYATHRAKATMGQVRSQIAQALGINDIFSVQLESSILAATPSTFKAFENAIICNRVNAIWDDIQYTDDTSVKDALPTARSPWVRVRKTEYLVLSLPDLGLLGCITPSETAIVGDIVKIAASASQSDLLRSFRLELADGQKLRDHAADLRALKLKHKAIITCTQELHECSLCEEQVGYLDWPEKRSATCEHEATSCTPCLRSYITAVLDDFPSDYITCPECSEIMDHSDVRNHTSHEVFARYDQLLTRTLLNGIPNFHWCISAECNNGQVHIPGKGCTELTCHVCRSKTCTACNRPYHEGESCEQAEGKKRMKDDRATAKEVARISTECPGCGRAIQLNGGCDHLKCPGRECKTNFCWQCGGLWPYGHRASCVHHPDFQRPRARPG